ncbi:two-component system, LuxR family, sensor kinase FixL [Pararobbsia alpina]|uniref:GAF domain-containing sensor histidine kinase n=1 Tax=Pararobbsia alpina TaxID=621374 RepID=UPI0039A47008
MSTVTTEMTALKPVPVPAEVIRKWQEIVDLLAAIMHVPAALIMRVEPPSIEVFVCSESTGNPYEPAEKASLNTGLYCETVMKTRRPLHVADALVDTDWNSNPDIKLGMISYLGVPISWPDGEIFGTICVLDSERNDYSNVYLRLLLQWRDVLQADLRAIATLNRQLEERETKIRRLVDADIIGIFIWDFDGRILEANDAFIETLGYEREEFTAARIGWVELNPPEWFELEWERWIPELRQTGRLEPREKEYFRKDGSKVPVLFGAAMFEDGGNQGVAFVLDLTARKRAESEARESERRYQDAHASLAHANRVSTLGQLVATISHEIRQPISACSTNAAAGLRWLSMPTPNIEEASKAFERISETANRAGEITERVRRLVKNAPTEKEPVALNAALEEVIAMTRGEAERVGVSVKVMLERQLPLVRCDRVQLQQVFLNLILNGFEAMADTASGPRMLTVTTHAAENASVVVSVGDTGPGVAPENASRVFEAFYTTKERGMGMGLSICRSILNAHGGTLEVQDNTPRGAVFRLTLPVA